LVILDEAARCDEELPAAVRPMLATTEGGGRLICLSTPFGKRGFFYESWENGGDTWTRVRVPASECPRISKEFLEEELRQLGAQRFEAEYNLAFQENDACVFPTTLIDAAFDPSIKPLWV
jgi:hypothetical protein